MIGEQAVLGPNVSLTASVPIIDVTGAEPVEHRGHVPPRAIVVPGTRPKEFPAGTFHLVSHAFFKALLFLTAGAVIHNTGGEQNMFYMGGLFKKKKER